jgi:hypothetical protein
MGLVRLLTLLSQYVTKSSSTVREVDSTVNKPAEQRHSVFSGVNYEDADVAKCKRLICIARLLLSVGHCSRRFLRASGKKSQIVLKA